MPSWIQRVLKRPESADADPKAEPAAPSQNPGPAVQGSLATKSSAVDRRSCARVNLELRVRLRFDSAKAMIASRTFDLSRSGAFISLRDPRPRGTRVVLTVEVDGTVIVLSGVVVRSSDGKKSARRGMGIQFTDVPAEAAEALGKLLGPRGG